MAFAQPEEEALKAVIEQEMWAFSRSDFKSWKKCWLQDDNAMHFVPLFGMEAVGWKQLEKNMQGHFASDRKANLRFHTSEWHIYQKGSMAYATFVCRKIPDDSFGETTLETRVLQKQRGKWKIALLNSSLVQIKDDSFVQNQLASACQGLYLMGRKAESLKLMEVFAEIYPNLYLPHEGMGVYYFDNGNIERAITYFKKALELNPNSAFARNMLDSMREREK